MNNEIYWNVNTMLKLLEKHLDERGLLFEVLRDDEIKENINQVYFSISKPNAIRGNHYHKRKVEWFSVVDGVGTLILEDIKSNVKEKLTLTGKTPAIVKIKPGIAHAIQNTGHEDMYLIVISSEVFNPEEQDTFPGIVI